MQSKYLVLGSARADEGHLEALENCDVLYHANFGKRIRYYRFKESARANAVKNLIEAWHEG